MQLGQSQAEHLKRTIAVYNANAEAFARKWDQPDHQPPLLEKFLDELDLGSSVLDVGCGSGRDLQRITRHGHYAVGIDLSASLLKKARARAPQATLRLMDGRRLHYPPQLFDGVWCNAMLVHLSDAEIKTTLQEIRRVMLNDGVLGLTAELGAGQFFDLAGRFRNLLTKDRILESLDAAGFAITATTESEVIRDSAGNQPKEWIGVIARKRRSEPIVLDGSSCPFCPPLRMANGSSVPHTRAGSIIYANRGVHVIPDLAPLTEGHVLLVTDEHVRCFSEARKSQLDEVAALCAFLVQQYSEESKDEFVLFEHGPFKPKHAGSCIDHAHFHFLPLRGRQLPCLLSTFSRSLPASVTDLLTFGGKQQSYLLICDGRTLCGTMYFNEVIPSQFLRSTLATLMGATEWRWNVIGSSIDCRTRFRSTWSRLCSAVDGFEAYLPPDALSEPNQPP